MPRRCDPAAPPNRPWQRRSLSGAIAFKRGDEKIWLEDTGRWFAGPDGKPVRAHGIVRAINERHERERKLVQLANFDALTGELNRARLIEVVVPRSTKR